MRGNMGNNKHTFPRAILQWWRIDGGTSSTTSCLPHSSLVTSRRYTTLWSSISLSSWPTCRAAYTGVCRCKYMCVRSHMCVCVNMCVFMPMNFCVGEHVCVCVCMCKCVNRSVKVWMSVCVCVCKCACVYVHPHGHPNRLKPSIVDLDPGPTVADPSALREWREYTEGQGKNRALCVCVCVRVRETEMEYS